MTYWKNEKFEDTIEEIRNRKSKEIQYNGHKNKDKWTNNDLQNTTNHLMKQEEIDTKSTFRKTVNFEVNK
jgi:hypothetical protein